MHSSAAPSSRSKRPETRNSYKFQRLREKIREAVKTGELAGKLPGERDLARRFHVNAKTLSKALTDLAAEGLLHRSIGRGTFVKGAESTPEAPTVGGWLLLADAETDPALINELMVINPRCQVVEPAANLRPSYLNHFAAVVDLAASTTDAFVRSLLVRNMPLVTVGREPRTYSTNAVLLDVALGGAHLARELALAGHSRFVVVEARNHTFITETVRRAAKRYCSDAWVDVCFAEDVVGSLEYGVTACICESVRAATQTMQALAAAQVSVPDRFSVSAVGWTGDDVPCSGYFITARQKAQAVAETLLNESTGRPTTIWLTGKLIDRGTTTHLSADPAAIAIPGSLAGVVA